MTLVAFDAKQFRRGRPATTPERSGQDDKYTEFRSQLGIGVSVNNPQDFVQHYLDANKDLKARFGIAGDIMPFFSSTYLKKTLEMPKAIRFADLLISKMQKHITSIHCSFVILPPSKIPTISVGGFRTHAKTRPTRLFIDELGPMFSYLTAHSYLWINNYEIGSLDIHIDSFRSKPTKAWSSITGSTTPKVFMHGDECNPFISCADIVAFLTDAKLYAKHSRLDSSEIEKVWDEYSFDVTTRYFDQNNLQYYAWKSYEHVDVSPYLARPVIFLAIDDIELGTYAEEEEDQEAPPDRPRKFNRIIKRSPVYYAALKYAFQKSGCVKLFSRAEDFSLVRDGDVFVYVGTSSEKIGRALQHAYDVQVLSGLEVRKAIS